MMNENELFRVRLALVQAFLNEHGYDGILLSRADNFAMATGGKRNYIWTYGDLGANSLFVNQDGAAYFVGTTIEETRAMAEELGPLGCESLSFLWFEDTPANIAKNHFQGNLVSDDGALGENVHGKLAVIRALLTETELEKYRRLGALAAEAMQATLDSIEAGMPEADIAARLVAEGIQRRCQVPVALVAADERIAQFRHPLPTEAPLISGSLRERAVKNYVEVVGCFLREGLVVSLTRFKQTGDLPDGISEAYDRICAVDALMQEASVPGRTLGEVFAVCQKAYADFGFAPNEWHNHHQGGATGYAGRTCKGIPGEAFPVLDTFWPDRANALLEQDTAFGAAFAWNPSAPGVKSEDTFILLPDGTREIVSKTPLLPTVDLTALLGRETEAVKSGMAGSA
jgi:Xaa-Pro aminopeptidase